MADDNVLEHSDVFWDWRLHMNTLLIRVFDYLYLRGHLGVDAEDWEELLIPESLRHPLMLLPTIGTLHTLANRIDASEIFHTWVARTSQVLVVVDQQRGIVSPTLRPAENRL